jgi:hypothetical protein
MNFKEAYQV